MTPDSLARLLSRIDRPVTPRPEFAEALLDRLLIELEHGAATERNQEKPMIDATARLLASPRPGVRLPASPTQRGRPDRALAYLATAALVAFTLVGSFLVLDPHRPGEQEGDPRFLAAPSGMSATPGAGSEPVAEFLWQADGGPSALLIHPAGAAVDPQGNAWVTDGFNGWFTIFSPEGVVLETWGTQGSEEGEFDFQCHGEGYGGVAFDAAGNIFVADAGNGRIQKFRPDRTFLTSWPSEGSVVDSQWLITGRGNQGVANRPPHCPVAIAVNGQGRVVVSDRDAGKIEVFDPEGRPLATGTATSMQPEGVALDGDGNIWVADNGNRVLKFSSEGHLLAQWDRLGTADGELHIPMAIAVDEQGRVFVSDQGNRVQVFAPDGTFLGAWGSPGVEPGQFNDPVGLALDGLGHAYVVEHFGSRVQKFRLLPPFGA
jgi:sugar lactone lactonase YvrE